MGSTYYQWSLGDGDNIDAADVVGDDAALQAMVSYEASIGINKDY